MNRLLSNRPSIALLALMLLCLPAACQTNQAGVSQHAEGTVATIDGEPITDKDLSIEAKLRDLEQQAYEIRIEAIHEVIAQRLFEKAAAKENITAEEYEAREISDKISDPSPAEVEAFYQARKGRLKQPLETVRGSIVQYLKSTQQDEQRTEVIDRLLAESEVEILISPPRVPIEIGDSHRRGPEDAPVTIVEFSDYQCPFCRRAQPALLELLDKYKGKLSLVYKDLPLREIHPLAQKAAEAARCAGDQGKFWEYHDKLFAPPRISADLIPKIADELELDKVAFSGCLDSGKHKAAVDADLALALAVGARSTPLFYVNGIQLKGAQPVAAFSEVIDAELSRSN